MILQVEREPIHRIVGWLAETVGDAPDSPHTLPWRISKLSEEIGEAYEAYEARDRDAFRAELCDVILTAEVSAYSLDPASLPRTIDTGYSWTRDGYGYLSDVSITGGRACAALSGMVGRNPRKGVTHTREQAVQALQAVSAAAAAALAALTYQTGPQGVFDAHVDRIMSRAGLPGGEGAAWKPSCSS